MRFRRLHRINQLGLIRVGGTRGRAAPEADVGRRLVPEHDVGLIVGELGHPDQPRVLVAAVADHVSPMGSFHDFIFEMPDQSCFTIRINES